MDLLLESAHEIGVPADPQFRSALISYFEWGWGETGGPYQGGV
jgi:hemoglobin